MIELNKLFTLTTPKGQISEAGIDDICSLIRAQYLQNPPWKDLNPANQRSWLGALPGDWAWQWIVTEGEYRGKFATRLSAFYYKQHALRCPEDFLQKIGELASRHSENHEVYHFDFVDRIDWDAGEYGDEDSCFWDSRPGAKFMLQDNGALAMRFFDDANYGFGRAWVAPLENGDHIVFNGYGFSDNSTLVIARVLAQFLNVGYHAIALTNNGSDHGVLWINGAGGYLIGDQNKIRYVTRHDFHWAENHSEMCHHCGELVDENETYTGPDDEHYCQDCFYELFESCSICGESQYPDDITIVDEEYVCRYCLGSNYTLCDSCENYCHDSEIHVTDTGNYCPNCFEDLTG